VVTVARTDGGRRFCSGRVVPRRVAEKGSRIYVVCCIHGWSALLWAHSKGVGSTKAVEYRTVSGRVIYYRENVILGSEKVVKFRAAVVGFYDGESGQDARGDGGR
jgi:hypothetical protein